MAQEELNIGGYKKDGGNDKIKSVKYKEIMKIV